MNFKPLIMEKFYSSQNIDEIKKVIYVSFKAAVASSDGKYINQHFGQAHEFLIFEIKENQDFEFIEVRKNSPHMMIQIC